jgi:hypothetical protein
MKKKYESPEASVIKDNDQGRLPCGFQFYLYPC